MSETSSATAPPLPPAPGIAATFARARAIRTDPLRATREIHAAEGTVAFQHMGRFRTVSLFGPDAMKTVLLNRDGIFSSRKAWNLIIGRIFTNGLMLRDGEDHRHHRSIMRVAFRQDALESYLEHMNPRIAERIAQWRPEQGTLHAYPAFKTLTLDLASSVFLGLELGAEAERLNRAFEHTVAASMSIIRLPIPGLQFTRGLRGRREMIEFFARLVAERRAGRGEDMLSHLCRAENEDGERYSDREIIDHMIFLMMAAHDTTTSTLTSMMYATAQHPEWQERIREESFALGQEQAGFDDLERMRTTGLVMNEALRRYPPLSTIPRMALRDFDHGGYRIPANTMVIVYPIHNHHMDEWWRDPFAFDPERFAEERAEHRRHTHLFVPFGGGAHTCIGLRFAEIQIKAIMHQLVRRYRWRLQPGYEMPVQASPISKPRDGLPVVLEPLA